MRLSFVPCLIALAGCPAGAPAKVAQPPVPKVGGADPDARPPSIEACKGGQSHDLMVLDWTPELRGDLEVAMKEGVAVLAYDCKSVKLVSACTLAGSYGYIGTTRREKKISMSSSDEIAANLPVGGLSWLSDVGGKLDRESALVAQLVMVGKRSSAKKVATQHELTGGCDGATHFVRAATVGAFVVAAGSKAELEASAKIIGKGASGGSTSSTKIEAQDGDLTACEKSSPDGSAPPDQCGAVVRIELEPIGAGGTALAAVPEAPGLAVATCAPGFAMADGACVRLDKPHQCKPGDATDCAKQCDAGNAASCATLAVMHRDGKGAPKDAQKAAALAKQACDKDVAAGCRIVGTIPALDKACAAGDGGACVDLGIAKLADKKLAADAQYAFRRACYGGGEFEGCTWLGTLYLEGKGGMKKNPAMARPFFEKGCKEGSQRACEQVAKLPKK